MIYNKTVSVSKKVQWYSHKHRLWMAGWGANPGSHYFLDVLLNLSFKRLIASFL